eukprot:5473829-Amphidinium_carterae.2
MGSEVLNCSETVVAGSAQVQHLYTHNHNHITVASLWTKLELPDPGHDKASTTSKSSGHLRVKVGPLTMRFAFLRMSRSAKNFAFKQYCPVVGTCVTCVIGPCRGPLQ